MFLPPNDNSRLTIQFENGRGPSNYYIPTEEFVTTSPYDSIDIHRSTPRLLQSAYHPLVTVEIGEYVYRNIFLILYKNVFCFCCIQPLPSSSAVEHPLPSSSVVEHPLPSSSVVEHPLPSSSVVEHPLPSSSVVEHPLPSSSEVEHPLPSSSAVEQPST